MKFLVAVDGSRSSEQAFDNACALVNTNRNDRLILVAVNEPTVPTIDSDQLGGCAEADYFVIADETKGIREVTLRSLLGTLAAKCTARGIESETVYTYGDPREVICREAREREVDVVVMGRRGLSKIQRIFTGSTTEYCTHHSTASVLIIQEHK